MCFYSIRLSYSLVPSSFPFLYFPTYQVRVSRYYQSYFLLLPPSFLLPPPNSELQSSVGTAGPKVVMLTEIWRSRLRSGSAHVTENNARQNDRTEC